MGVPLQRNEWKQIVSLDKLQTSRMTSSGQRFMGSTCHDHSVRMPCSGSQSATFSHSEMLLFQTMLPGLQLLCDGQATFCVLFKHLLPPRGEEELEAMGAECDCESRQVGTSVVLVVSQRNPASVGCRPSRCVSSASGRNIEVNGGTLELQLRCFCHPPVDFNPS